MHGIVLVIPSAHLHSHYDLKRTMLSVQVRTLYVDNNNRIIIPIRYGKQEKRLVPINSIPLRPDDGKVNSAPHDTLRWPSINKVLEIQDMCQVCSLFLEDWLNNVMVVAYSENIKDILLRLISLRVKT